MAALAFCTLSLLHGLSSSLPKANPIPGKGLHVLYKIKPDTELLCTESISIDTESINNFVP